MVKARFEWVELFILILVFLVTFGIASNSTPTEPNFVPDAVGGLATMAGILTATARAISSIETQIVNFVRLHACIESNLHEIVY